MKEIQHIYSSQGQKLNEKHIEVIEFQHGIMGKYQLGYSFPKEKTIHYFPDKLILFSKYWQDSTELPISNIELFGYPHLTNKLSQYYKIKKDNKQIMIISQPSVADTLIEYTIKIAKNNPDFNFIYRLHPKEKSDWKLLYPSLELNKLDNLLVDDTNTDIYLTISSSKFILAVSSATILESLLLDAVVILINLNGIEHMEYLIKKQYVTKINQNEYINFKNFKSNQYKIDKNYLFYGYD